MQFLMDAGINQEGKISKTNLYLKGLPSNFADSDILELAPDKNLVRSVKAAIEEDGRCKGYGFIDFITPEHAKLGLEYIQKTCNNYTVKYAKENEKDRTNLYVCNLPKSWINKDSDKLKELFSEFGEIQSAFIMVEKFGNKPLGVGFVRFYHEEAAQKAIRELDENPRKVSEECDGYLEAKFADKHAPETRQRRLATNVGGSKSLVTVPCTSSCSTSNNKLLSSNTVPLLSPGCHPVNSTSIPYNLIMDSSSLIKPPQTTTPVLSSLDEIQYIHQLLMQHHSLPDTATSTQHQHQPLFVPTYHPHHQAGPHSDSFSPLATALATALATVPNNNGTFPPPTLLHHPHHSFDTMSTGIQLPGPQQVLYSNNNTMLLNYNQI